MFHILKQMEFYGIETVETSQCALNLCYRIILSQYNLG